MCAIRIGCLVVSITTGQFFLFRDSCALLGALLIKTDDVACRVAEPCRDLGRVCTDGLHDLAPVFNDLPNGRSHVVNHYVNQQPGFSCRRAPVHPAAAHFADRVVEGCTTIATRSDVPAKNAPVKLSRAGYVPGGKLEVTDLA